MRSSGSLGGGIARITVAILRILGTAVVRVRVVRTPGTNRRGEAEGQCALKLVIVVLFFQLFAVVVIFFVFSLVNIVVVVIVFLVYFNVHFLGTVNFHCHFINTIIAILFARPILLLLRIRSGNNVHNMLEQCARVHVSCRFSQGGNGLGQSRLHGSTTASGRITARTTTANQLGHGFHGGRDYIVNIGDVVAVIVAIVGCFYFFHFLIAIASGGTQRRGRASQK
mmetsp:Transcript_32184/g.67653  ORF Transcript_32184/g.67653 Transcript_32184/m.67653 type:complete len:225 (-) Transcript_32184:1711-2385(-)